MESPAFRRECFRARIDIIHCPYQWINPFPPDHIRGVRYIMNLHDLQHEHFPEFFTARELRLRRRLWYESARASRFVVAAAKHVKRDIVHFVGIPAERVHVIPWGPWLETESLPPPDVMQRLKAQHGLPDRFLFYPAVMWPHKNHLRLLEAIVRLRQKGERINLVFTGGAGPYVERIEAFARDNGLELQVHQLGFVCHEALKCLYGMATGVVVPSLYEQTSGPLMEAMTLGCPVAAGMIADHEELAGGGCGLLFDPRRTEDIERCVKILWSEKERCAEMAERARRRIRTIRSWRSCIRGYLDLYRVCEEEEKKSKLGRRYSGG